MYFFTFSLQPLFFNVIYYFVLAVSSQIDQVVTKLYMIRPGLSRPHELKEQSDAQIIEHRLVPGVRF